MYCQFANVSFCKPKWTFCELLTALTKQMYNNMYCTLLCIQVVMWWGGTGWGNVISVECEMLRWEYEWLHHF
jgi:hypothetical protein